MRAGGNQLATVSPTFSSFVGEFGGLFLSVKISVIVYIIVSAVKWFCIVFEIVCPWNFVIYVDLQFPLVGGRQLFIT